MEVAVGAEQLDEIETVMDFHVLEAQVDAILAQVHNRNLNEIEPFVSEVNPTAERVAWWMATLLAPKLPLNVQLLYVRIGEAPGCFAMYRVEG